MFSLKPSFLLIPTLLFNQWLGFACAHQHASPQGGAQPHLHVSGTGALAHGHDHGGSSPAGHHHAAHEHEHEHEHAHAHPGHPRHADDTSVERQLSASPEECGHDADAVYCSAGTSSLTKSARLLLHPPAVSDSIVAVKACREGARGGCAIRLGTPHRTFFSSAKRPLYMQTLSLRL